MVDVETLFEHLHSEHIDIRQSLLGTCLIQEPPVAFDPYIAQYTAAFQQPSNATMSEQKPLVVRDHTDAMRLSFEGSNTKTFPPSLPMLQVKGDSIPLLISDFVEDFIEGYSQAISSARQHKEEIEKLLTDSLFQHLRCRIVLCHTAFYIRLLWQIQQPQCLLECGDGGASFLKNKLFERSKLLDLRAEKIDEFVAYELESLLSLDIPVFYCNPMSTHLETFSNGEKKQITHFFPDVMPIQEYFNTLIREESQQLSVELLRKIICVSPDQQKITVLPCSYSNLAMQLLDKALVAIYTNDSFFHQTTSTIKTVQDELSLTTRLNVHDGLCGCLVYTAAAYSL